MKQVMNCHKDNGLLNMIRRTDPMILQIDKVEKETKRNFQNKYKL